MQQKESLYILLKIANNGLTSARYLKKYVGNDDVTSSHYRLQPKWILQILEIVWRSVELQDQ
jgi:hypothetical protein